jgi:hypothetical protein
MCIASLESGYLPSQCSFYAILFSALLFVHWNCFQLGPQFVLDFSEFDSFCSSFSNLSRLSRIFFTLFFHWRPTLRTDDSSNSMHMRSLCNGMNNFYLFILFYLSSCYLGSCFHLHFCKNSVLQNQTLALLQCQSQYYNYHAK